MKEDVTFQSINETVRQQFESGWIAGDPQPIEAVIGDANASNYLATLEELVHIELEFRWKNRSPLKRVELEEYLERFEQLNQPEIVKRLIQQEVQLRSALGEVPTVVDYAKRFPGVPVDFPDNRVAQQDTGHDDEDEIDTRREMATIMPSSVDQLDEEGTAPHPDRSLPPKKQPLSEDAIPGYDLLGELGRGGMGVVYKARDQKLKRIVALKMILSGAHASDDDMQRFQTEAEAVARLQHPNIVQIYEVAEHSGNPYIALEFADAGNLDQKISGTPQNAMESAQLLLTLAQAIEAAHQQAIIHRDLKPANILLTADGEPKITDFGLAKRMDDDSNQTKSGAVMGTPSYMAPEQAANSSDTLGPTADVYSLGAILYHLLTGRPPFQAATQLDTLMQVIGEEPVSPRRLNKSLPLDLETICLKCLEKSPPKRYGTAAALASDLDAFIQDLPITARPINPLAKGIRWARRNTYKSLSLALLVLVMAAIPVYQYFSNEQLDRQHAQLQRKNRDLAIGSIQIMKQNTDLEKATKQLQKQNVDLGAANEEVRRQAAAALHAEYVATVNLVDQDTKVLSFRSAKQRIDRFNQRITADSPDPRGIEWQQLSGVVDNSFTELVEPGPLRIRSFAVSESADVVLYNMDNPNIDHSNQLRLYDAVEGHYLCDEPITIPQIAVDSPDGLILQWVGGRTFVLGNHLGLFALTVKEGVNETTSEDIKTLDAGAVYGITGTGRDGEFMVVYIPSEEAAKRVLRTKTWQLNDDESMVTFTPAEQLGSLASGEQGDIKVKAMAISPDRQFLAVARGEFLEVRDLETGALLSTIQAKSHTNSNNALINDVTFIESSEGVLVAIAGNNKMVELFMLAEQGTILIPQRELRGHASFIQRMAYDPDTGWLLTASNDQSIFCWSPLSGERNFVLDEHDLEVIDISFTDRGRFILSASFDGSLIIRERVRDDRWSPGEPEQIPGNVWSSFYVLPGSDRILIGGGQRGTGGIGSLSLVDVKTQRVLDVVSLKAAARRGTAHPDKSFVLVPLVNGDVIRCDLRDDQLEVTPVVLDLPESLDPEKDPLIATMITYVPGLQRFYVGMKLGEDRIGRGVVGVIDGEGNTGRVLETQVERGIYSLAISPKGDLLAMGTNGRSYSRPQVWIFHIDEDEQQLKPVRAIQTNFTSLIYDLAFHPDGNSLYVAGNHKNILRLMLTPPVVDEERDVVSINNESLYGHFHSVARVAISNSGRRLISFGFDGLLCVWDLQSGQLLTKKELSGLKMFDMAQDPQSNRLWFLIDDQIVDVQR